MQKSTDIKATMLPALKHPLSLMIIPKLLEAPKKRPDAHLGAVED